MYSWWRCLYFFSFTNFQQFSKSFENLAGQARLIIPCHNLSLLTVIHNLSELIRTCARLSLSYFLFLFFLFWTLSFFVSFFILFLGGNMFKKVFLWWNKWKWRAPEISPEPLFPFWQRTCCLGFVVGSSISSRSGGSISSLWLLAVWGKCSRNTWSWTHAKSIAASVWNVWHKFFCNSWLIRSAFLRSTFDKFPINGVGHVVKKVPSHRRAEPVRWNRAMADSTAASATRFAESKWSWSSSSVSANDRMSPGKLVQKPKLRSQVGSCSFEQLRKLNKKWPPWFACCSYDARIDSSLELSSL